MKAQLSFILIFVICVQEIRPQKSICEILPDKSTQEMCIKMLKHKQIANNNENSLELSDESQSRKSNVEIMEYMRYVKIPISQEDQDVEKSSCEICKLVVNLVYKLVGTKRTEAKVRSVLNEVCGKAPIFVRGECKKLVAANTDKLVKFILKGLPTKVICGNIGKCVTIDTKITETQDIDVKNSDCEICKLLVELVYKLVGSEKTEDKIRSVLNNVCDHAPIFARDACKRLVAENTEKLVKYFLKDLPDKVICGNIGKCVTIYTEITEKEDQDIEKSSCEICKLVVNLVYKLVGTKKTEAKVRSVLNEVCGKAPIFVRGECKKLVAANTDKLVKFILKGLPTKVICGNIGKCVTIDTKMTETLPKSENVIECYICRLIMKKLEKLIDGHHTKEDIEKALDKVCHLFWRHERKKCDELVHKYAEKIVEFILSGHGAKEICKLIMLCSVDQSSKIPEATKYFIPITIYGN